VLAQNSQTARMLAIRRSPKTPRGSRIIRYFEYARALKEDALEDYSGTPSACRACGLYNAQGLFVRCRSYVYCLSCVPDRRRCSRCRCVRPLSEFRVGKTRIESPCIRCSRKILRVRYHLLKDRPRPIPATQSCQQCGLRKPANEFYRDGRYSTGLLRECRRCKDERSLESQARANKRRVPERNGLEDGRLPG
jgi:hypothetical protein